MHYLTIAWTLICAGIIVGYPIYLFHRSSKLLWQMKKNTPSRTSNTVDLLSFDLRGQLPSWSISLEVPQITEEVLSNYPILFYLESEDSCLKLPINNATLGYTASVFKNTGKVYVTFKCLVDGVSNFHVPAWHVSNLKVLIIKPREGKVLEHKNGDSYKALVQKELKKAKVNITNYEDVLMYFSNTATLDFKGHFPESRVATSGAHLSSAVS